MTSCFSTVKLLKSTTAKGGGGGGGLASDDVFSWTYVGALAIPPSSASASISTRSDAVECWNDPTLNRLSEQGVNKAPRALNNLLRGPEPVM